MREWVDSDIKQPHQLPRAVPVCNPKSIGKHSFPGGKKREGKAGASPPLSTRPRKHTHVMLRSPPYSSLCKGTAVVCGRGNLNNPRQTSKFLAPPPSRAVRGFRAVCLPFAVVGTGFGAKYKDVAHFTQLARSWRCGALLLLLLQALLFSTDA
ncbi:MAG: hypothetical protein EBS01_15780, partial [Verrucomicrobia bacterium]|nr:hypothetical protein [Verrucomicrobiota bacterium]